LGGSQRTAHPAGAAIHLGRDRDEHRAALGTELRDGVCDRIGQAPRCPALALGLAHDDETAFRHHRQGADGVEQCARSRTFPIQAIEVEVTGPLGQDGLPNQGERVVAKQRLLSREEIGGAQDPLRELRAQLLRRH
jgi:hypothetical protein